MPREIEVVPYANNDLPADYLFTQRKYYVSSSEVYQIQENTPKPLDPWYEKPYWGKIDTKQRLVFPDNDYLSSINDNVSVFSFVADAYNDFKTFALDARFKLRSSMTSFIDIENPKKGYEDVVINYKDYFENTLDPGFINTYLSEEDKSSIKNFVDYANEYVGFATVNPELPHTLCGYLQSPITSYRSSGLVIELADDDYADDAIKWTNYLSNDFFNDYARIAASFGFYINKHVPWAIVANLNSSRMKNYMIPYGISSAKQLFNSFFYQAEYISYISFKKYMFFAYASFISYRPRIEIIRYKNCIKESIADSSFKTEREITLRPSEISYFDPSYSQFTNIYSDYTFLNIYVKLRLFEEGIKLNKGQYNRLINKLIYKIKPTDTFDAMLYFSDFLASNRQNRFNSLTRKKSFDNILQNKMPPSEIPTVSGGSAQFDYAPAASSYFADTEEVGSGGSSTSGY